tara:strand:+ start:278 stop:1735 length:1458 start_codon:yes stop_codon:yes gene_type:complete
LTSSFQAFKTLADMSIHFTPKYKKDILVDKNKGIWMDYETGTLHYDSCWLDELPVDILKEITKHIWVGHYNNCKTIQKCINPYIEFCDNKSIRELHSHSDYGEVGSLECDIIENGHPLKPLYYAYECQPAGSNRYLGTNQYPYILKPEWMNNEFTKLKINGKKVENLCYWNGKFIQVAREPVDLCKHNTHIDWRDDPCPCLVKKYNNWIKQRKYNMVYEDNLIANNKNSHYRFNFKYACKCKDEITYHPLVIQLFTIMYRNNDMKFCDFYKKAFHMSPDIDWKKFRKEAKRNFAGCYYAYRNNIYQRGFVKMKFNKLESALFNNIVNGFEIGWLWCRYLENNNMSITQKCKGRRDGVPCSVNRTCWDITFAKDTMGEFRNAKKVNYNTRDDIQHIKLCGKCKNYYCKYGKKDTKASRLPATGYSSKTGNNENLEFKLVEFMKDYCYEIRNGYLVSHQSKLFVSKRYQPQNENRWIDVSKIRYFGK